MAWALTGTLIPARGWILTGDQDPRCARVRELHGRIVAEGLACRLEVVPGLGHELPEGFPERLSGALAFVAGP